ncbi:MAG TPA: 4-hydroxythreonine-4-phosphate dehydrogenase PdxA [Thermoanaerobaculia bacterium]|nr:4-hydroxythreonine-4-phosphate dehydrogenase PdxA [Thermoanaerobaculia bacterium]
MANGRGAGLASPPILALTQGDPAGIGPEILLKLLAGSRGGPVERAQGAAAPSGAAPAAEDSGSGPRPWVPLLVAERAACEALASALPDFPWDRLAWLDAPPGRAAVAALAAEGRWPALDPVGRRRAVTFGESGPADAAGALAALDAGIALAGAGIADALVTAPVSKASIARQVLPGFTGHTEYLAAACGLERYGRDYLMAFLAPELQVALLSTHLPLRAALDAVTPAALGEALDLLHRAAGGRIAVAGVNPHAGEGGLLGGEDDRDVAPAVAAARERGIDAHGPESADSLFARARRGEFDWVLALYHDQGLIAVKTASFGTATNWTLGLPWLRTSVDHGTAYPLAGRGVADAGPLAEVVETTCRLLAGELPRRGRGAAAPIRESPDSAGVPSDAPAL